MEKLTKDKMIQIMCESEPGLTKAAAGRLLNKILDEIMAHTASGAGVTFANFGSFSVVNTKEREGRHPQTGEPITIPAGKRPKFTPGKGFKTSL